MSIRTSQEQQLAAPYRSPAARMISLPPPRCKITVLSSATRLVAGRIFLGGVTRYIEPRSEQV